jgi:citrate/tricarballylate utilization protein
MLSDKQCEPSDTLYEHGQHVLTVCNACRYCEGYCPVFPAVEQRMTFAKADLNYLANLCHNCGECLYACQYAPPHEFGINVPRTLAEIRLRSYEQYCWPRAFAVAFRRHGTKMALLLAVLLTVVMAATSVMFGSAPLWGRQNADFYRIVPHAAMVALFGIVGLYVSAALLIGLLRFWRDSDEVLTDLMRPAVLTAAIQEAGSLRHLHGTGVDCPADEQSRSPWRRWFHHCTMYGFLSCLVSTTVAAVYHSGFGWPAPYPMTSAPVILGAVGGLGLVIGPAGLFLLRRRRDPLLGDPMQEGLDTSFIALLFLTSASGLLLLIAREAAAMAIVLLAHLGSVLALFVTLPYGKFVHGMYRTVALVKHALETARAGQAVEILKGPAPVRQRPRPIVLDHGDIHQRPAPAKITLPLDGV